MGEPLDPSSLVSDELSIIANRLRAMVVSEVPKLSSAAEYFFKKGVEGKRFRSTVLLLMSTALNITVPEPPTELQEALSTELRARHTTVPEPPTELQEALSTELRAMHITVPEPPTEPQEALSTELRARQQRIAEITEMFHVASLLHDDVLDDADTRRGVGSVNCVMGNKLAVLAGDFLLSRACVALASLRNTEVVLLMSRVVEHLVTGETMQMTTTSDQRFSMEYYMQKTYYKTASLISNSCKAIAVLAGHTTEVAALAYEYGKNLGLAFQLIDDVLDFTGTSASLGKASLSDIHHGIVTAPILFAMEEFPQLRTVVEQGLDNNPANIELALSYLGRSRGIHRTRELATKHANLAAAAIKSLPKSEDENVRKSRRALVDLTQRLGFNDLNALPYHDPVLLVSNVEKTLVPKLEYLEGLGFPNEETLGMVLRCPELLTFNIKNNFKPKFEYFSVEMGKGLEELKGFRIILRLVDKAKPYGGCGEGSGSAFAIDA